MYTIINIFTNKNVCILLFVVKQAKEQYKSFRTIYRKRRNEEKEKVRSGAGTSKVTKSKWKYMEALRFLDDVEEVRQTTSSLPDDDDQQVRPC